MNSPKDAHPEVTGATFLLVSTSGGHITWLENALAPLGSVVAVPAEAATLDERIAMLSPQAVFIDFSHEGGLDRPADVQGRLRRDWPALPLLGMGSAQDAQLMLQALRAGVDDFVDLSAPAVEAQRTLRALMERRRAQRTGTRGCTVALLGARAGLGVTTLATNLALAMQDMLSQQERAPGKAARSGVALLDLGLPARDGLLYLDSDSTFSFVDGVHNLKRLDQTLIQTALSHHASGLAVLPLPASLAQVKGISHAESAGLIRRLGDFFDFQIADLGGFTTVDFVAQTVRDADKAWIVCDQSLGAIVSTAALLRELNARGLETSRFSLVVNRFDPHVDLTARDIASRLGLPLAHVLPARSAALLGAASRGEMLVRTSRSDPYSQAVMGLAKSLRIEHGSADLLPLRDSRWSSLMLQLTGRIKSAIGT